jgi:hypothetical protein
MPGPLARLRRRADQSAAGSWPPAGSDPNEPLDRGVARRRLRALRRMRDDLLVELGAIVYEQRRHGRDDRELVDRKTAEVARIDGEARALDAALRGVAPAGAHPPLPAPAGNGAGSAVPTPAAPSQQATPAEKVAAPSEASPPAHAPAHSDASPAAGPAEAQPAPEPTAPSEQATAETERPLAPPPPRRKSPVDVGSPLPEPTARRVDRFGGTGPQSPQGESAPGEPAPEPQADSPATEPQADTSSGDESEKPETPATPGERQ